VLTPLVVVWPVALPFWAAYVWAFAPETTVMRRAKPLSRDRSAQDSGSLQLLAFTQFAALIAAFLLAFLAPSLGIREHRAAIYWSGVVLLVGGALLRRHCFRMLGAQFTGRVQVSPDDAIIERGAYRWVRHPSYSAAMVMFAGIGLALGNWASLAVLFLGAAVGYSYRVVVEERALLATLGDSYRRYMDRTARFVPFIV
jgi:protein-S-isoprenylcysteine O-methyltransferase Ste14